MKTDNWASERRESAHAREKRVCEKFIKHFPKEIDMHKVRVGKTIYYFNSKRRLNEKLKELEDYEYVEPGQELPEIKGL